MNSLIKMRNANTCQRELTGNGDAGEQQHSRIVRSARRGLKSGGERSNPAAGSPQGETTEPPGGGEEACQMAARRARSAGADAATGSERGKWGMRSAEGAFSPRLKFSPVLIFSLLVFLFLNPPAIQAQDENPGALSVPEALPLESYLFAMHLPPNTDCTVMIKDEKTSDKKAATGKVQDPFQMKRAPVRIDRLFRPELCMVREVYSDNSDAFFFFTGGFCAFDDSKKGINVRRQEERQKYSEMDTYHFPELLWAGPELRKDNKADPTRYLYEDPGAHLKLEVDSLTKRPVRFSNNGKVWTYSYQSSTTPIAVPEKLVEALKRTIRKPSEDSGTQEETAPTSTSPLQ